MNKTLKGSETEKNLQKAFEDESIAANRYLYFSHIARREGYEEVANFFLESAKNERVHSKIFLKSLGENLDTVKNLEYSILEEKKEWSEKYLQYAETARKEGFLEIANKFSLIYEVERNHEKKFSMLLNEIKKQNLFSLNDVTAWRCSKCGNIVSSHVAPQICQLCLCKQGYFKMNINYL